MVRHDKGFRPILLKVVQGAAMENVACAVAVLSLFCR